MKSNEFSEADKWAYVHGEADEEGRAALEHAMRQDAELRAAVDRMRQFDRLLRASISHAGQSQESLAERILGEWDASQAQPAGRPTASAEPADETGARWVPWPRSGWARSLALAAGLLIAVGGYFVLLAHRGEPASGLKWAPLAVAPLVARGGPDPVIASHFTAGERDAIYAALREAVDRAFREQRSEGIPPRGTMHAAFEELFDGAFVLRLGRAGARPSPDGVEWAQDFLGLDDFQEKLPAFADRVARELSVQDTAGTNP